MGESRLRRGLVLLLGCALVSTACGGSDGEADADTPGTTTAAPAATSSTGPAATTPTPSDTSPAPSESTTEPPPAESNLGLEPGRAAVTIGDTRYEFGVEMSIVGRCEPDFFGAFWVIAAAADGSNGGLEMFIVPEGNANHDETSKVKVDLSQVEGVDWRADEDGGEGTPEGESWVESFTIDGNSVSGTASFVETYSGDGATAQGTFEASCA